MPQFQTTEFGFPVESQGGTLYGGTGIADWEDRAVASNGMGKRMGRRRYRTKFGDCFVQTGFLGGAADSLDTTAFKQGCLVHTSVSNFSDPGFTYNAAIVPGGSWQTTYIDPLCQRIAHLPFNAAVAGGSPYGGVTRNKIKLTMQHEVNAKGKAGAYGSTVAATPAEFKAFCKFVSDRLVAAGARSHVDLVFVSTGGITYSTLDPYWDATIFDEWGCDLYCNMNGSFNWNGSTSSFATNIAPVLAYARSKSITKLSFPEFSVGDAHTSAMRQWWIDAANYIATITDIKITSLLHWGQANHPDQNVNFSAAQDTGTVGTATQRAHPEQHDGIVQFMGIMLGNEILTSAGPTTPPAPTGLTAASAADGKSINFGWAAVGSPGDRMDFYIQGPGDSFPHKDNASPLPVTPRSYTFSTNVQPGQPYIVTAVLSDSTTALRSGFATKPDGTLLGLTTSTPGATNSYPQIVSATATVDPADPLHFTLAAVATDPDIGQTLTYQWPVTNSRTGLVVATLTGTTVEFHAQTEDSYDALLSVTDSGSPPLTTSQHVQFNVHISSPTTDFLHMPMLKTGDDIRQAGVIDRASKPILDANIWQALHRRTGYNARHRLVGSNYDPGAQAGTNVVTPVAKDLWFTTITMEAETIAHLRTVTARAQIGTGALGCFFDPDTGQGFAGVDPFSVDAWLQQTAGVVDMDPPQQITGFNPGDPAIFAWWWPPTGTVSQYPQFRVRSSGGVQASIPSKGISIWGSYSNLSAFPASLDLTTAIIQPEIWLGVPEQ